MGAVDAVEAEVRELVRRRGLDPVEDRAAVRELVADVVTDYDERALTSSLAPLPDARHAARTVFDAVAGFGPQQSHLDDPEGEEVWINERLTARWTLDPRGGPPEPARRQPQAHWGSNLDRLRIVDLRS